MSFLFTDPTTTLFNTLSLHDALPIYDGMKERISDHLPLIAAVDQCYRQGTHSCPVGSCTPIIECRLLVKVSQPDRKSTRLNSSHLGSSYAVFCLKKISRQVLIEYGL